VACPSGLRSTPRKRVTGNPRPRVQIPPPPPQLVKCQRWSAAFQVMHLDHLGSVWAQNGHTRCATPPPPHRGRCRTGRRRPAATYGRATTEAHNKPDGEITQRLLADIRQQMGTVEEAAHYRDMLNAYNTLLNQFRKGSILFIAAVVAFSIFRPTSQRHSRQAFKPGHRTHPRWADRRHVATRCAANRHRFLPRF
jgi:hypothetical protein